MENITGTSIRSQLPGVEGDLSSISLLSTVYDGICGSEGSNMLAILFFGFQSHPSMPMVKAWNGVTVRSRGSIGLSFIL